MKAYLFTDYLSYTELHNGRLEWLPWSLECKAWNCERWYKWVITDLCIIKEYSGTRTAFVKSFQLAFKKAILFCRNLNSRNLIPKNECRKKSQSFWCVVKLNHQCRWALKRSRYVLQNQIAVISNRSEDDQGWFSCVSSSSLCYRCRLKFLWLLLRTVAWTWLSWLEIKNAVLHLTKFIILCSKKSLN